MKKRRYSPTCTCGHVLSSHKQRPNDDPWITERCHCGCAAFSNRDDDRMQSKDDEPEEPAR